MNKCRSILGIVLILVAAAVLSGGCGGGSSSVNTNDPYYEPPNLTETQLIELGQTQVNPSEFDLPELHETETSESSFKAAASASENALARKVWTEAVKLFTEGARYTRVTEHPQSDGTNIYIRQSRYVYVYRWVTGPYEVEDERLTVLAKQHKYREKGCQHGMFGTDCVGLIWNAANNAGITLWGAQSKSRIGPSGLTSAPNWKAHFPNADDVSDEIGTLPPKPGDIVSWSGTYNHVGIVAKVTDNNEERIVIIHCTGRTDNDYLCSEYKEAGEADSMLNEAYPVNGVTAHDYSVTSGIPVFGRESRRLRLALDSTSEEPGNQVTPITPITPENPTTPETPTTPVNPVPPDSGGGTISASALNGTWTGTGSGTGSSNGVTAQVQTELRYIISNVNETSGGADIQIYDRTTDSQYGVNIVRDWGDSVRFDMTKSGGNSWTFHRSYSDGEDNITITLRSENSGTLQLNGSMWNEDNPSDRTTFNITCNITKQ